MILLNAKKVGKYAYHINPLNLAQKNDLTFFDSINYKSEASMTKGGACITTEKLEKF